MIKGGCFCGKLRYELDESNYTVVNCHCGMCRKINGAAYVTWLVVPSDKFHMVKGEPTELDSSEDGTRYFCNHCGTPVSCTNTSHPDIVDVTLGSLDDPSTMKPSLEIHADTRLEWASDLSGLKIWKAE